MTFYVDPNFLPHAARPTFVLVPATWDGRIQSRTQGKSMYKMLVIASTPTILSLSVSADNSFQPDTQQWRSR